MLLELLRPEIEFDHIFCRLERGKLDQKIMGEVEGGGGEIAFRNINEII